VRRPRGPHRGEKAPRSPPRCSTKVLRLVDSARALDGSRRGTLLLYRYYVYLIHHMSLIHSRRPQTLTGLAATLNDASIWDAPRAGNPLEALVGRAVEIPGEVFSPQHTPSGPVTSVCPWEEYVDGPPVLKTPRRNSKANWQPNSGPFATPPVTVATLTPFPIPHPQSQPSHHVRRPWCP
jgi:hypothetical protein